MELRSYLAILVRRKWVIIITVTVTAMVTAIGSYYFLTPKYVASATLWVPTMRGQTSTGTGDILLADRLMNTYATISTSDPVLTELEQRLGTKVCHLWENSLKTSKAAMTRQRQEHTKR